MTTNPVREALLGLNVKQSIKIESDIDSIDYFDLAVGPLKLGLQINESSQSLGGIFTIGMVGTKNDAESFVPNFLNQFDGLPIGPFLISLSPDEVGCLVYNHFRVAFHGSVTESQLLRELEQQTILASMILISLAQKNLLLYPDSQTLDKYQLNIDQPLYRNVAESGQLLRAV